MRIKTGFKSIPIFGYLLILLNICQFLTIIPSLLFGNEDWYYHESFILFLNILFLLKNKVHLGLFRQIKKNIVYYGLVVLCVIFILELPRFIINSEGRNIILTILNGMEFIAFYFVLSTVYYKDSLKRGQPVAQEGLIKAYVVFASYIVCISVFIFILASLKIIDPSAYPMASNLSMTVDNDATTLGTQYFFPLHLAIVISDNRGIPFFSNYGVFCGLSHEPHITTYITTPALFFLQTLNWGKKTKLALTTLFIVFLLIATSTTNLIAFMVVLFVLLIINVKNGTNTIFNIILMIVIIGVFSFFSVNQLGLAAVKAKLDTSSGTSMDYSKNFLSHVVSPKEFWGEGAFNVPFPAARVRDIGILSSILCIGFYVLLLGGALKLMFATKRTWKFIGAGSLYFLLHTLKIVQLVFLYPFLLLIIFYMLLAFKEMKLTNSRSTVKL